MEAELELPATSLLGLCRPTLAHYVNSIDPGKNPLHLLVGTYFRLSARLRPAYRRCGNLYECIKGAVSEQVVKEVAFTHSSSNTRTGWRIGAQLGMSWLLLALLMTPPVYFAHRQTAVPWSWMSALISQLYTCGVGLIMTPLALWFSRRFPLERAPSLSCTMLHVPLAVVFALVLTLLYAFARDVIPMQPTLAAGWTFATLLGVVGPPAILVYAVVIAANYAIDYFRKYREQERRLAQARLQALKMQLNPHFLFNTLTAISELGYTSPETADQTITQLSGLLRSSLDSRAAHEITLAEELTFLRKYLDIQQTLLGERLKTALSIEPESLEARLPNMSLQPLVENAIIHGISRRAAGGSLKIRTERRGRWLRIEISDNGPGLPKQFSEGIGLGNLRARLEQLYPGAYHFELHNVAEQGVTVVFAVPFAKKSAN